MTDDAEEDVDFIGFRLPASHKEALEEEAYQRSEPGEPVSLSAVARELVAEHVDELQEEERDPQTRGFSSEGDDQ